MSESNGHAAPTVPGEISFYEDEICPRSVPVKVRDRNNGRVVREYVLKGASTEATIKFRTALTKAASPAPGGDGATSRFDFGGVAEAEAILVQCCTFEVVTNTDGTTRHGAVSPGWVRAQPPEFVRRLFKEIKTISPCLLGDETKDEEIPLPKDSPNVTSESSS